VRILERKGLPVSFLLAVEFAEETVVENPEEWSADRDENFCRSHLNALRVFETGEGEREADRLGRVGDEFGECFERSERKEEESVAEVS
jgi:hypothetical protein